MITTVSIRNNPALYLHPITNQLYPDGKSHRNCRDPHASASARSQNHPSTHQYANSITRTTPRRRTCLTLVHKKCVRRFCREVGYSNDRKDIENEWRNETTWRKWTCPRQVLVYENCLNAILKHVNVTRFTNLWKCFFDLLHFPFFPTIFHPCAHPFNSVYAFSCYTTCASFLTIKFGVTPFFYEPKKL